MKNDRTRNTKIAIGEDNYFNSKSSAVRFGFKQIDDYETKFELSKNDFNWDDEKLEESDCMMHTERFKELRKRVFLLLKPFIKSVMNF
ncbi:MAG: hypothetical protein WBG43_10830 [Marinifilaceae bacterium]